MLPLRTPDVKKHGRRYPTCTEDLAKVPNHPNSTLAPALRARHGRPLPSRTRRLDPDSGALNVSNLCHGRRWRTFKFRCFFFEQFMEASSKPLLGRAAPSGRGSQRVSTGRSRKQLASRRRVQIDTLAGVVWSGDVFRVTIFLCRPCQREPNKQKQPG